MKYIIIIGVVIGVGLVAYLYKPIETVVYHATEPEVIEKKVEVNPLDERIKEREHELEEKYRKIQSIEARRDVLMAERDRLDEEIASLQKELAGFTTGTQ